MQLNRSCIDVLFIVPGEVMLGVTFECGTWPFAALGNLAEIFFLNETQFHISML